MPETGIVIFCGTVVIGHQERLECHVVTPPEIVPTYLYRCSSAFDLQPLHAMQNDIATYGLLAIDTADAAIGILRGTRIEQVAEFSSRVPRKHSQGGQSAQRFERLREIAIHEFFKKVADAATALFTSMDGFPGQFKGLIIGGLSPSKDRFISHGYLHHELQARIIGVVDVPYTTATGLYDVVSAAQEILVDIDLVRKKQIVEKFLTAIATDGGAAYGYRQVVERLQSGAVAMLLISTAVEPRRVEGLTTIASQCKTTVEMIPDDFPEGVAINNVFGGVAALLRY
jgi:peptide chain release factor subunit 1